MENLSADINIDFEIRRSIAKQSVKVFVLVEEWEWEPDKGAVDSSSQACVT